MLDLLCYWEYFTATFQRTTNHSMHYLKTVMYKPQIHLHCFSFSFSLFKNLKLQQIMPFMSLSWFKDCFTGRVSLHRNQNHFNRQTQSYRCPSPNIFDRHLPEVDPLPVLEQPSTQRASWDYLPFLEGDSLILFLQRLDSTCTYSSTYACIRQTPNMLQVSTSTPGKAFYICFSWIYLKHTMLLRNKLRFTAELDQGSFDLISTLSLNIAAPLPFSISCSLC